MTLIFDYGNVRLFQNTICSFFNVNGYTWKGMMFIFASLLSEDNSNRNKFIPQGSNEKTCLKGLCWPGKRTGSHNIMILTQESYYINF